MLLVDKNIKELVSQGKLIVSDYKEENLKGTNFLLIAYMTLKKIPFCLLN